MGTLPSPGHTRKQQTWPPSPPPTAGPHSPGTPGGGTPLPWGSPLSTLDTLAELWTLGLTSTKCLLQHPPPSDGTPVLWANKKALHNLLSLQMFLFLLSNPHNFFTDLKYIVSHC